MSDNQRNRSPSDGRSRSPSGTRGCEETSIRATQVASSPIQIRSCPTGRESTDNAGLMTDANGEPIPIDRIIKTANTMSTMMMAHKIALDDDFRLEPGMDISGPLMSLSPIIGSSSPKGTSSGQASEPNLQSKVKDIVHDAYWDLFKEELASQTGSNQQEKKFDLSKQLLRDIRQKMTDLLLPQHARLKQEIEDKLDLKIIDQLSVVESLDLQDYAKYILDVLSKLCAPVRDEMLKQLSQTQDLVQVYRGIMDLLELMRLDFANFTLNRFKPHIKAHSQEYEREKFNEILNQQRTIGIDGLEYTKIWLKRAVEKVDEIYGLSDLVRESQSSMPSSDLSATILTTNTDSGVPDSDSKRDRILRSEVINRVLNSGYCELLEWSVDKQKLYPETLLFDEATFKSLGHQYRVLVLTASILLTVFAYLNQFKLNDNRELKVLCKSHVITLLTATYDSPSTSSAANENSPNCEKLETIATRLYEDVKEKVKESRPEQVESLECQRDMFRRQILDINNAANRVRELARRRILEFVETLLSLDVDHQKKKFSSEMPPPVNIPLGLNCLADEIALTMAQLVKIIRYNRKVFFQHYQDIILELVCSKI